MQANETKQTYHPASPVMVEPTPALLEETCKSGTVCTESDVISKVSTTLDSPTAKLNNVPEDFLSDRSDMTAKALFLGWYMEIGACVVSLASLVTIIVVLTAYDGKALHTLPWSITLNTFLAFFTTLTRVTFMASVVEAISQWKWNLLKQSDRPLRDFLVMDSASRTAWGSVLILRRFHVRHIASIGALISLLGLITSPLTQQMIDYPLRTVAAVNGTATIPTTSYFNRTGTIDQELLAVLTGLNNPYTRPIQPLTAECSSTNCTFPPYNSLAICSHVADVTSLLEISVIQNSTSDQWSVPDLSSVTAADGLTAWNASLPNGFSLVTPVPFAFFSLSKNKTLHFVDDVNLQTTAVSDMFLIWSNNRTELSAAQNTTDGEIDPPWSFHAAEIVHNLCVNTYQTNFTAQASSTSIVSSSYVPTTQQDSVSSLTKDCGMDPSGAILCYTDPVVDPDSALALQSPDDKMDYVAGLRAMMRLHYGEMMQGYLLYNGDADHYDYLNLGDWFRGVALWGDALEYSGGEVITDPKVQIENIASYYNGIATAVSNFMRSTSNETARGTAWSSESFVKVRWSWIILLAGQLALSSFLLLLTIISTYSLRLPILKSAVLGPLLASTDELRRAVSNTPTGLFPNEKGIGENVVVRLRDNQIVLIS